MSSEVFISVVLLVGSVFGVVLVISGLVRAARHEAKGGSTDAPQLEDRIVGWAIGDGDEHSMHDTRAEAIDDWLDMFVLPGGKWDDRTPETVEVVGYARVVPVLRDGDSLDRLLGYLDEEYGDPDAPWSEPTDAMRAAERRFHEVVRDEYEPWMCEPVRREMINVREWINRGTHAKYEGS